MKYNFTHNPGLVTHLAIATGQAGAAQGHAGAPQGHTQ